MRKLVYALILVSSVALPQAWAQSETKAIVGATVVSLDGGAPIDDAVVVIEGERIKAIGPASSTRVPSGAEVIRADGTWLIPGLMNMHVHYGLILPGKMRAELGMFWRLPRIEAFHISCRRRPPRSLRRRSAMRSSGPRNVW